MPDRPENGEVIRVSRKLYRVPYSHYGVYVEGGTVIHYARADGSEDFKGVVRETGFAEFLDRAKEFYVFVCPSHIGSTDDLKNLAEIKVSAPNVAHLGPSIWDIFTGWSIYRKKRRAEDYHLYSGAETVELARSQLGTEGCNLITNNCEHFAIWCRTGLKKSSQVNKIIDIFIKRNVIQVLAEKFFELADRKRPALA